MRLYLYQLKILCKTKDIMFWTLAFPIVLGTLFYASFGRAEIDSQFKEIPIAVVYEEKNDSFEEVLNSVSKSKDNKESLFQVTKTSEADAKKKLFNEKLDAYIIVNRKSISVKVMKSSISANIVETFVNEYLAQMDAISTIAKEHPEKIQQIIDQMKEKTLSNNGIKLKNKSINSKKYNPFINYFYALIAMTCLLGSMFSLRSVTNIQANQSALGARRNVAPTKKTSMLLADIMAGLTIQVVEIWISLLYFAGLLKIDFGGNIKYMMIMSIVGSFVGNSMGMFIGTVIKGDENFKSGVIVAVTLVLCFFAGLMWGDIVDILQQKAPIINAINPATVMTNAFHSLAIYDNMSTFYNKIVVLLGYGIVMNVISILIVRRKKYASL